MTAPLLLLFIAGILVAMAGALIHIGLVWHYGDNRLWRMKGRHQIEMGIGYVLMAAGPIVMILSIVLLTREFMS